MPKKLSYIALLLLLATRAHAQDVTELYVAPDTLHLEVCQKEGLNVQAFDQVGNAILRIGYKSSDEKVVRVQPGGTVLALGPGAANISVQAGKKTKTVQVFVTGAAAAAAAPRGAPKPTTLPPSDAVSLSIEPATIFLLPAENLRLVVHGVRADGSVALPPKVTWKSLRPEIATVVDSSGVVVGNATGQGVIQVTSAAGLTASVPVVVGLNEIGFASGPLSLFPEDAETLRVVVPAQGERTLRGTDLQWRSSDPAVVQVTPNGVIRAVSPGKAEVIASGFLQERQLSVTVHPPIASFLARPALGSVVYVPLQGTRDVHVQAEAADSTPISDIPFQWSVADTAIANFDPGSGLITGRKLGTTTLGFTVRGFLPKSWTVQVVPGEVSLDRPRFALRPGDRQRIVASGLGASGETIGPPADVTWTSSNPSVATVGADGTVEALGMGKSVITATVTGGKATAAEVFVVGDLLLWSGRDGKRGIYTMRLSAPDTLQPILVDGFSNLQAVYSPDRTRIAFSSDRFSSGGYDVYVADADGKNPKRLTTDPGQDMQPVWMPDGGGLVFTSNRSGTNQLYRMNADGSEVRELTTAPGGNYDPAVSPDGKRIAFASGRDGLPDVFIMDLDGGNQSNLSDTKDRREAFPEFFPNGEVACNVERKDGPFRYQVLRLTPSMNGSVLVESKNPIAYFSLSRDGKQIAYVLSELADKETQRVDFSLLVIPVAGGPAIQIPLKPGEQIATPAF